ncbi:hypothetical protein Acy02nite_92030 [Actinoplanes cyaneus]|uniref:Uncharacterized protein n=1 Tax=Actinoplanes cyaneus TaxID=52696 RepID=A0A919IU46_9ACTN|nr:hypothetical protein [Actinoplanes cyaneus]GID71322.1 hypothetical protein Acy02nite_92030 [Actinoplanes cyaneus]
MRSADNSSDEERQAIADHLLDLSLPELLDVLRRVLPAHADDGGDGKPSQKLVLAEAMIFGQVSPGRVDPKDPPVTLAMVAWPDHEYYEGGMGPTPHLFEGGTCPRCGIELTSNVKRAFCPACGKLSYLT